MLDLDFLKKIKVFRGLNDDQLGKIQAICHEKEYKREDQLFREGDDAAYIWIVIKGQVDIRFDLPARASSEKSTVYSEKATDIFGWSTFVPPYKYILSAYCAGLSCTVALIPKESLTRLFESDYDMGYIVMSNMAGAMSMRFHDLQKSSEAPPYAMIKITVHMSTCGIAAGAREVMTALQNLILKSERHDITLESAPCLGKCKTEPNVTVTIEGEGPTIYQHMNADRIERVFNEHILKGSIPSDLVLT